MHLVQQGVPLLQRALQLRLQPALAVQLRAQPVEALLERPEDPRDRAALDAAQRDQPLAVAPAPPRRRR